MLNVDNLSDTLRGASPQVQRLVLSYTASLLPPTDGQQELLSTPGAPLSEDELLSELEVSRAEIARGHGLENEEARQLLAEWRNARK